MTTIQDLTEQLKQDKRNQAYSLRGIGPIFQVHPKSKILLIGQAPGRKVEETGIPFNDPSGDRLRQWLEVDRQTFYSDVFAIMPMDFYYPGKGKTGDLPPRSFIAKEYHQKFISLMPELELTVLIGKYATDFYLKGRTKKNLTETIKNYQAYLPNYFPVVHPSPLNFRWQRQNPWFEEEIVPILRKQVHQILKDKS